MNKPQYLEETGTGSAFRDGIPSPEALQDQTASYRRPSQEYTRAFQRSLQRIGLLCVGCAAICAWDRNSAILFLTLLSLSAVFPNVLFGPVWSYAVQKHQDRDKRMLTLTFPARVTLKLGDLTYFQDYRTVGFQGGELVFLGERCDFSITDIVSVTQDQVEFRHEVTGRKLTLTVKSLESHSGERHILKPFQVLETRKHPSAPLKQVGKRSLTLEEAVGFPSIALLLPYALDTFLKLPALQVNNMYQMPWVRTLIFVGLQGILLWIILRARAKSVNLLQKEGIEIDEAPEPGY